MKNDAKLFAAAAWIAVLALDDISIQIGADDEELIHPFAEHFPRALNSGPRTRVADVQYGGELPLSQALHIGKLQCRAILVRKRLQQHRQAVGSAFVQFIRACFPLH